MPSLAASGLGQEEFVLKLPILTILDFYFSS